jgi:peptide/nickel transport system permease protein
MWSLILRRLLVAIPTLFLVMVFVFILQRMLPGDPLLVMAGEERDPAVLEEAAQALRVRPAPFVVQFLILAASEVATGNFGASLRTGCAGDRADCPDAAGDDPARRGLAHHRAG